MVALILSSKMIIFLVGLELLLVIRVISTIRIHLEWATDLVDKLRQLNVAQRYRDLRVPIIIAIKRPLREISKLLVLLLNCLVLGEDRTQRAHGIDRSHFHDLLIIYY